MGGSTTKQKRMVKLPAFQVQIAATPQVCAATPCHRWRRPWIRKRARPENSPQRWLFVNFWGLCSCPKLFHVLGMQHFFWVFGQVSSGFLNFSLHREEMIVTGCVEHGHYHLLSQPRIEAPVVGLRGGGNENSDSRWGLFLLWLVPSSPNWEQTNKMIDTYTPPKTRSHDTVTLKNSRRLFFLDFFHLALASL